MHTFDPTGDSAAYAKVVAEAGSQFHAWGLAGAAGEMANPAAPDGSALLLPLGDIVERLGHGGRHIDILKIDCEVSAMGRGGLHCRWRGGSKHCSMPARLPPRAAAEKAAAPGPAPLPRQCLP